jgi:C4-dicarboxylate-specific signal transduction histidine kinase
MIVASIHHGFYLAGFGETFVWLSAGFILGVLFLAFSVNSMIDAAYQERDRLRTMLERIVHRKTEELKSKTADLGVAKQELMETQAELIHSGHLASLGTLAAGIAHEVNNSLNYVNGALRPLERLLDSGETWEGRAEGLKAIAAIQSDLRLTFEIIKSLRTYTGLNQAKFTELSVLEVISSVLRILKSKIGSQVQIACEVSPDIRVHGNVVGLSQVFMNMINNALDAMQPGAGEEPEGRIDIWTEQKGSRVAIYLRDSGAGIPEKAKSRIFEPFFTMKAARTGAGLGLYIVKTEIDRHQGLVTFQSTPGKGTTFAIELPLNLQESSMAA